MTAKGWCPTLFAPMQSGDGLLVRVRPPGGVLPAAAARTLAEAARRFGNGAIDLTNRASLQVRGLRPETVAPFAARMVAVGIAHPDPDAERRRGVIAPPLADDDPCASPDAAEVVAALETMLARETRLAPLPAKFSIVVDAGGVLPTGAAAGDIRVLLSSPSPCGRGLGGGVGPPQLRSGRPPSPNPLPQGEAAFLSLDGSDLAAECDPADVAEAVARLAIAFMDLRTHHRRMRALAENIGAETLFAAAGLVASATVAPAPPPTVIGWLRYPGTARGAFGVGLPFGGADAATLAALADTTEALGDGSLRLTPWRAFAIPGVTDPEALRARLENLGLITTPDDFRARISACPGKPACASATVAARADAARLAAIGFAGTAHVSGCAKGCAHPGAADLTLVGDAGRYAIVRHGRAGDPPTHAGLTFAEALAAVREGACA